MNIIKGSIRDFFCAFLVFAIILMSIALVAGKGFSDDAVVYDEATGSLRIFDVSIEPDRELLSVAQNFFCFNDNLFGKGFSSSLKNVLEAAGSYMEDFFRMAFFAAEKLVGAG